jgi:hypothetical protein
VNDTATSTADAPAALSVILADGEELANILAKLIKQHIEAIVRLTREGRGGAEIHGSWPALDGAGSDVTLVRRSGRDGTERIDADSMEDHGAAEVADETLVVGEPTARCSGAS